jgi:hypothetical protein
VHLHAVKLLPAVHHFRCLDQLLIHLPLHSPLLPTLLQLLTTLPQPAIALCQLRCRLRIRPSLVSVSHTGLQARKLVALVLLTVVLAVRPTEIR